MGMKIIVVGIVGALLLCAAAATCGYYAGKSAKPVSRIWVATTNSGSQNFIHTLMEVKADISEVLNRTDPFGNLKQIATRFRFASGNYLLALKHPSEPPMDAIESKCLADADAAIARMKLALMSVDSCEHAYAHTGRFCSPKRMADASDYLLRKTGEATETLNRCLDALQDLPTATAVAR
jgi:hypothetical protein